MCGSETYSWSIQDAPPHTTTTFDPVVTATDQPTTFYIQTDSTTVPGTYQSRIVSTRVSTGTTYTDDAIPLRIRCNFGFRLCPELEIVDLVKGADSVVSYPKPKHNTFIGQKMRLRYRWKAGTGTPPYSYNIDTLTAPPVPRGWTLSGNVIKSYDITTGTLTALPDIEKRADTISYYYAQGNATTSTLSPACVAATISRSHFPKRPRATTPKDQRRCS
jgi:hypothetical protein